MMNDIIEFGILLGEILQKNMKIGIALIFMIALAMGAWVGGFGGVVQRWMIGLVGQPFTTMVVPAVQVKLTIVDKEGRAKILVEWSSCRSGERILATTTLAQPAYVLVFGWDDRSAYPFTDGGMTPQFRKPGEFRDDVILDENIGIETIFVVAASSPFTFVDDIQLNLVPTQSHFDKGGRRSHAGLSLPERFAVDSVACQHDP